VNVAMRKLPDFFDEKEISIVESGEQTGMIQESFLAIANDLRGQEELKNKITSAMTYPVIIILFLILAISVVMVYVVPQLMPIIGSMAGDLPFTTRALIGTSNFLKDNYVFIFISFL
jgi:type II secretory pathway component PulF